MNIKSTEVKGGNFVFAVEGVIAPDKVESVLQGALTHFVEGGLSKAFKGIKDRKVEVPFSVAKGTEAADVIRAELAKAGITATITVSERKWSEAASKVAEANAKLKSAAADLFTMLTSAGVDAATAEAKAKGLDATFTAPKPATEEAEVEVS